MTVKSKIVQLVSGNDHVTRVTLYDGTLEEATDRAARTAITAALKCHGGNVTHAAKALGLTRNGLQKKLAALGIDAAQYRKP